MDGAVVQQENIFDIESFLDEAQVLDVVSVKSHRVVARQEDADWPIGNVDVLE